MSLTSGNSKEPKDIKEVARLIWLSQAASSSDGTSVENLRSGDPELHSVDRWTWRFTFKPVIHLWASSKTARVSTPAVIPLYGMSFSKHVARSIDFSSQHTSSRAKPANLGFGLIRERRAVLIGFWTKPIAWRSSRYRLVWRHLVSISATKSTPFRYLISAKAIRNKLPDPLDLDVNMARSPRQIHGPKNLQSRF